MKARKGFIATTFAVLFAVALGIVAMYAVSLGLQTTKEETRMTEDMERSVYPIAWSVTNAMLHHLKDKLENDPGITISADNHIFTVPASPGGIKNDVTVSCDVGGSRSIGVRVTTGASLRPQVDVESSGLLSRDVIVRGFLYPDSSGNYTIIWR